MSKQTRLWTIGDYRKNYETKRKAYIGELESKLKEMEGWSVFDGDSIRYADPIKPVKNLLTIAKRNSIKDWREQQGKSNNKFVRELTNAAMMWHIANTEGPDKVLMWKLANSM